MDDSIDLIPMTSEHLEAIFILVYLGFHDSGLFLLMDGWMLGKQPTAGHP
jgi:hypothetical protein